MKSLNQLMLESKAAVIVVDVQNDYCHPEGALPRAGCDVSGVGEMMPKLHKLLQSAREFHVPVIFIQTLHEKATDSDAWTTRSSGRSAHVCRRGAGEPSSMRLLRSRMTSLSINTGTALL